MRYDRPTEQILVLCEYCGSEGRILLSASGHPNDPDTIDGGECPACEGTGREFIPAWIAGEPDPEEREAALASLTR